MTDISNKQCPYEDTDHPPLHGSSTTFNGNRSEPVYQIRRIHLGNHDTVVKTGLTEVEAKAAFLDTLLEMKYWPAEGYGFSRGSIRYYVTYDYGAHAEAIWISPQPPLSESLLKAKRAQIERAKLIILSKERRRKKLEDKLKKSWAEQLKMQTKKE